MKTRINLQHVNPQALEGIHMLEAYLEQSPLSKTHFFLIFTRASQINGCAYCIHKHTQDALKNGESQERLFLLDAWRETNHFTREERAILAITEEVTLIHQQGLSDATYQQALEVLSEDYIVQVILAVVTINAWNRVGISARLIPARSR